MATPAFPGRVAHSGLPAVSQAGEAGSEADRADRGRHCSGREKTTSLSREALAACPSSLPPRRGLNPTYLSFFLVKHLPGTIWACLSGAWRPLSPLTRLSRGRKLHGTWVATHAF